MDAPDPQEAESGRERQRLVQFSIFWSQMIASGYVLLLDYAGLKNLNVWSLRTPLMYSSQDFFEMRDEKVQKRKYPPYAKKVKPNMTITDKGLNSCK